MRIDELPRSDNVEDRRGQGGGFRRGGIGIGTLIVLGLIAWILMRGFDALSPGQQSPPLSERGGPAAGDQMAQLVSAVLGSSEVQWRKILAAHGRTYEPPTLVMFSGATPSACGFAQSAMGPFYCPIDRKVYLDTSFFQDLERRFRACDAGSKTCQFSQAYVITHEVGHHVQNLLGILPRVQRMQQGMDQIDANQLQVRVELQADCFAGLWAHHSQQDWQFIEPGDVEAAMQTASAIGDDMLQRRSQGYVVPDAFTHGSARQRTRWFMTGLKSGSLESCDTYAVAEP